MNILVLLIKDVAVEVSSRLVVSEELGLYRLNIPNQWLRVLSLGGTKKELVMDGRKRRRMANTTHFVGSLCNPHQGCILKLGTHSPNWCPSNPFPSMSADQHTQTPAKVGEHGFDTDCCSVFFRIFACKCLGLHENRKGQDWPSLIHAPH